MDKLNEFFNVLFESIRNKPSLSGLIIASIALIMLIAVILDADWMLEGGNGFFNIASISRIFGRTVARFLMGLLSIILIITGILISCLY